MKIDKISFFGKISEHPLIFIFSLAFLARLVTAITVAIFFDNCLFADDCGYLTVLKLHIDGRPEELWTPDMSTYWNIHIAFYYPAFLLSKIFGFHLFIPQLLSVIAGSLIPLSVTAILKNHTSLKVAIFCGAICALWPSQVLWSSVFLRDSASWTGLISIALILLHWTKTKNIKGILFGGLALASVSLYLGHVRSHTLVTAMIALLIAVLISISHTSRTKHFARISIALLCFLFIPLISNVGIAGSELLSLNDFATQRAAGAVEASTSLVQPAIKYHKDLDSDCFDATGYEFSGMPDPNFEYGQEFDGYLEAIETCRLNPDEIPEAPDNSWIAHIKYLPTGLRIMLIDPLPNQLHKSDSLIPPFLENIIWYPVLLFAMYGIRYISKRNTETLYIAFTVTGLATTWGMIEGNFGTAFRHRGELFWGVIIFAGLGLDRFLKKKKCNEKVESQQI
tara:strand:- start:2882 stop:4237 length:1356 start_codon:yes stop_codon:yes gene_type:complete